MRFLPAFVFTIALLAQAPVMAGDPAHRAQLFKNPECQCCEAYADYLRQNGFEVTVKASHDLSLIKQRYGVKEHLEGCHTTLIDGYVIEGHVPIATITRLLEEHPKIRGISLPGMPMGSPGMNGVKEGPLVIYEIGEGRERVYGTE